jgi:hypothetical protein
MPGGATTAGVLRYLTVAGLVLLGLMMSLEVEVGFSAPAAARLWFWVLQISTGLIVLQSVLYLLTRRFGASRAPSWSLVLLSAVLGAAVLAPVYWLIGEGLMQRWLGYPANPDDDGGTVMDAFPGHPLVAEYLDIVGPVTAAWALICLSRLHGLVPPTLHAPIPPAGNPQVPAPLNAQGAGVAPEPPARPHLPASMPPPEFPSPAPADGAAARTLARPVWCERLPTELGTDVIAVASELQYLRVWTPRGCALILGALADVEAEGAVPGLRVHRSWWVACDHVVSVRRTASGAVCVMSDGRQVPVSRRRRAEVLARFGDGALYRVAGASEAVARTDLE